MACNKIILSDRLIKEMIARDYHLRYLSIDTIESAESYRMNKSNLEKSRFKYPFKDSSISENLTLIGAFCWWLAPNRLPIIRNHSQYKREIKANILTMQKLR